MAILTLPQAEDVVISRQSPAIFTLGVRCGTPQVQCRTFEEALQRAGTFASDRHVHLWFTADEREFTPLANEKLLRRLWSEFVEMPGLRLTAEQAQRLWSVDERTCTQLLGILVNAGLLTRSADGRYARSREGSLSPARMAKADTASKPESGFRPAR